jgi:RND family efflux transporter MFP subunit
MSYQTAKGSLQFILVLVFLGLIYLLNFGLELMKTKPEIQSKTNEIPTVKPVTLSSLSQKISFTDTAQVSVRSYIPITPQVTGRIVSIAPNFKAGLCFDKNQILFSIDISQIKARLDTALAELEQAKANLSLVTAEANAAIKEWTILNPTQAIPPLVAKEPQIKQAKATIDTANAKVKSASVDLQHAQFSYPFAGCVESSTADIGQFANTGQSLGQVFAKDSLEIVVNLPTPKATELKNAPYSADIVIDNRHYAANLDRISDVIDSATQFSKVILKPTDTQKLYPNTIGTVTFYTKEPQDIFVITDADIVDNTYIRLVESDNVIRFQKVEIVGRKDNDVYIKAFAPTMTFVRGIHQNLQDKMPVQRGE